jgi:UDP-N-acetylmuramyl-tripeptide synthetase
MKLGHLVGDLAQGLDSAAAGVEVTGLAEDSRLVKPGDLFVAVRGLTVDGHDFAGSAVGAGAVAVVAERALGLPVPCIVVEDPARALALAAFRLEGEPSRRLELVGITGTNGKTTTTYLVESILAAAGGRPGVVGTVTYRFAGSEEKAPYTTPTPLVLAGLLGRMVRAGCTHAVMEVSSHALHLGRVFGLDFSVAAFSNLTQDHLDLHGDMGAYLEAKLLLFRRHLRRGGTAVVNLDGAGSDAVVRAVRERGDVRLVRCSTTGAEGAEAALVGVRHDLEGLRGELRLPGRADAVPLASPLLGAYNADNILLAAACCAAIGAPSEAVASGVSRLAGVPGRLERINPGGDPAVLVDYAHTPDALERAIAVLRPLCRGRLLVVFGCGGDRDRTKRPIMGRAVARLADIAVVTSDNPRTEDPLAILEAILEGVRGEGIPALGDLSAPRGYSVDPDRRGAIFAAVRSARPGDIVLVAGKGHEDYQILGRTRIHFDDREQARAALGLG